MIQELPYADYQSRQERETTTQRLAERAAQVYFGEKFQRRGEEWVPLPYPGYAVLAMLADHPANQLLAERLVEVQEQLLDHPQLQDELFLLPRASFHQTIANTLSAERYFAQLVDPGLEASYPATVGQVFASMPPAASNQPPVMAMIGLGIFGSALGMLGVFPEPADFTRILEFRDHFYQHPALQQLGIQRTRPFIGHITLAYFGENLATATRLALVEVCTQINQGWQHQPGLFHLAQARLYHYDHLAAFAAAPHFPTYSFFQP